MIKSIQIFIPALLLLGSKAFTQSKSIGENKWGFETELIQPFLPEVGIVRIQATRKINVKGDLLIGAYIRPNVKHDIVEKINEYLFMVGYRQFFWNGLHVEAKSNIGFARGIKNKIDGKDYNNFSWFWEANTGYKFDFAKKLHSNFYVIPQFGILSSISSDIGPRGGKTDTFIQGNLLFGYNF
jgi:hypothetical protein